jgi:hypothetical protein
MDLSSQFSAVAAREVLSVGTGADIGDVIDHLAEATGDFVTKSTLLPRAAVLRFENTLAPKRGRKRPRRPQRAK